jgi:hypothetical protein
MRRSFAAAAELRGLPQAAGQRSGGGYHLPGDVPLDAREGERLRPSASSARSRDGRPPAGRFRPHRVDACAGNCRLSKERGA